MVSLLCIHGVITGRKFRQQFLKERNLLWKSTLHFEVVDSKQATPMLVMLTNHKYLKVRVKEAMLKNFQLLVLKLTSMEL